MELLYLTMTLQNNHIPVQQYLDQQYLDQQCLNNKSDDYQ